jgi:hypothetical protein
MSTEDITQTQNQDDVARGTEQQAGQPVTEAQRETEKTLKQSEVNRIVGSAKAEAFEKGRRSAVAELQTPPPAPVVPPSNNSTTSPPPTAVAANMSENDIMQMVENVANRKAAEKEDQAIVDQFMGKMQLGMQKHDDFNERVGELRLPDLNPAILRNMMKCVSGMDNGADVMYEMANNPSKFANVTVLFGASPKLATGELNKISTSIKRNQEAAAKNDTTKVNEPLGQLKSSMSGVDNGGPKSVSDFRKLDCLRG